jgi:hypothetical protein
MFLIFVHSYCDPELAKQVSEQLMEPNDVDQWRETMQRVRQPALSGAQLDKFSNSAAWGAYSRVQSFSPLTNEFIKSICPALADIEAQRQRLCNERDQILTAIRKMDAFLDSLSLTDLDFDPFVVQVQEPLADLYNLHYKNAIDFLKRRIETPFKSSLINWLQGYGFAVHIEHGPTPSWYPSLSALLGSSVVLESFAPTHVAKQTVVGLPKEPIDNDDASPA